MVDNDKKGNDRISPPGDMELSAKDLVLDLLSTHDDQELSVAALCFAGELCGLRGQNVRVALNRLQHRGKVINPDRGLYRLETGGSGLFAEVRNWLGRERRAVEWGGDWVAVLDSAVPRRDKTVWRHHGQALLLRGFRALDGSGPRLRPNNLAGGVAGLRDDLARLGMAPEARVLRVTGLAATDEKQARRLWQGAVLKREYRRMARSLAESHKTLQRIPEEQAARESLLLGRAAIRLILHDPLLPDELIDNRPRHRLIERMGAYQREAKAIWMRLLETV